MNGLTRTTNVISSTTSFQYITKSLHVFSNITSQADVTNRKSICFAPNKPSQRGSSVPPSLDRNFSNFCIHPEKLKQIIKEKDGQMLCKFFGSEEYKQKVTQITQNQKEIVSKGTPIGVNEDEVKYEHVLSCAQPVRKRKEYIIEKPDAKVSEIRFKYERERVPKKITVMSAILKRKSVEEHKNQVFAPQREPSPLFPAVKKTTLKSKKPQKRYKKMSTILPIYLKKMERDIERRQQAWLDERQSPYGESAKKISDIHNVDFDRQVLNAGRYEASSNQHDEDGREEGPEVDTSLRNNARKKASRAESRASQKPRKRAVSFPNIKLVEYSDSVPKHLRSWPPRKQTKQSWTSRKKAAKSNREDDAAPSSNNKFKSIVHSDEKLFTRSLEVDPKVPHLDTKMSLSTPATQMKEVTNQGTPVAQMKTAIRKQLSFLTKKLMKRRKSKKIQKLSESTKENLPAISEFDVDAPVDTSDLNKVCKRNMSTYRLRPKSNENPLIIDDVLTLYEKIKTGTSNEPLPSESIKYPFENEDDSRKVYLLRGPSQTYKIVRDNKKRRDTELKENFESSSKSGQHMFIQVADTLTESDVRNLIGEEGNEGKTIVNDVDRTSTSSCLESGMKLTDIAMDEDVSSYDSVYKENGKFCKSSSKSPMQFVDCDKETVEVTRDREAVPLRGNVDKEKEENRKLGERISRPPTPFVDFVKKDNNILYNRTFYRWLCTKVCQEKHLVRLPKTTPEGYRILMYSVRDNDPTKMNFSDCIKGFCMYNDCILSEDGLQEGYIVIFDMKGVQIGHLARVSLPALRCFLLYIQEGHPCRLKSIHVLNTASWIHHIMRLVVPLVKSEILSLIKFHKGSVPEGLSQELLPMDLGGEAPTIDELDRQTKSMIHKYRDWLIETGEFKSDESKRTKKASWWGFFSGTNKTNNVELDEKTILKNLQVD